MMHLFSRLGAFNKKTKIFLSLALILLLGLGIARLKGSSSASPSYQTQKVSRDTLIVNVSVSGQVSSANSAEVTTQASGVIKTVYVKDGDTVTAGTKIADIDLDLVGQQRAQQTYASYQGAKNNVDSARANLYTTQNTLLTEWEQYMDKAQNDTYENPDGSPNSQNRALSDFVISQNDWLSSEAKYKIQEQSILQAQTSLSSAWYTYQQTSSTIVAPIAGTVTGLSLQPGNVINAQTNSSGGSSSQRIASVKTNAPPTISLNITQIDAPKIKAGNKATITFDAFPDKTYTGEVISIDTVGSVSSGVTTYPAIVKLDTEVEGLLPNMSASASIITATKTDVLTVPTTALQMENGTYYVQVLKNKQMTEAAVETGLSNDSQTEITSGLSEGDVVVTSTVTTSKTTSGQSASPFSSFGRGGGTFIRR